MNRTARIITFLLRVSMGWVFLYAGLPKVLDSGWSAEAYLLNASTFASFYQALAVTQILPIINQVNQWGLVLIGASLVLGAFVRLSSLAGVLLLALYYFPVFDFPHVQDGYYLVSFHVIYALVLLLLYAVKAGRYWGWDGRRGVW